MYTGLRPNVSEVLLHVVISDANAVIVIHLYIVLRVDLPI